MSNKEVSIIQEEVFKKRKVQMTCSCCNHMIDVHVEISSCSFQNRMAMTVKLFQKFFQRDEKYD